MVDNYYNDCTIRRSRGDPACPVLTYQGTYPHGQFTDRMEGDPAASCLQARKDGACPEGLPC